MFINGSQSLTVAVDGPLNVDDLELSIRAAIDGRSTKPDCGHGRSSIQKDSAMIPASGAVGT